MRTYGVEQVEYGKVNPWYLLGLLEGSLRRDQSVDVDGWNELLQRAVAYESSVAS